MSYYLKELTKDKMQKLIAVSQRKVPATTWIRYAQVLQIYTGETSPHHVVISDDRIAYVGEKEPMTDEHTHVIDANGMILVPGYVEPHSHPFQVYNPLSLVEFALSYGTTTLVQDNLPFMMYLEQQEMERLFAHFEQLPVKNFWWGRIDPQMKQEELMQKFSLERVRRTMQHPAVLQAGELTLWKLIVDGDDDMVSRMLEARKSGKRIETHNPGASVETLNAMAAAGATGCHESINAEEVMRRIRLGYYTPLRNSSIRPDLKEIIEGLLEAGNQYWDRMMFTTDGSPPFFHEAGFIDQCIRIAMEAGLDPIQAYRMASLNPAVYYGLDQDLGGISPGRFADINFIEDLSKPTPVRVMANGNIVAEKQSLITPLPKFDWDQFQHGHDFLIEPRVKPEWFEIQSFDGQIPVIHCMNAVITTYKNETLPVRSGKIDLESTTGIMYAALIDRKREWITVGLIRNFGEFDALASSYAISGDLVVIGKDPNQMAKAVNHVLANQGGICMYENDQILYDLPLPLFHTMSPLDMKTMIKETRIFFDLMRERGYIHEDPIYSMLFLSTTHLPKVRLSAQGVIDMKADKILIPSKSIS